MARTIKPSDAALIKRATQSYIMTSAKFKYTLTEERIKNALLDNLWRLTGETKGVRLGNSRFRLHKPDGSRSYEVDMPISDILKYMGNDTDPSKNYEQIKRASKSMQTKILEVENTATGDYWGAALIMNVYISKRSGIMKFQVADWVMTALLDLTKGFTQYELDKMQSLNHASTMRAYELVSNSSVNCISFTFEHLKEFFMGTPRTEKDKKKYSRIYDFEKRVLKPAKEELDASNCPWTFDYQIIKKADPKTGKVSRNSPVEKINIYPIHRPQLESPTLETNKVLAQLPPGGTFGVLKPELYDYLVHNLGWTKETIGKNKQTFVKAQEVMEMTELLSNIARAGALAREKENPIGYVVNAVKTKTKEVLEREGKKDDAPEDVKSGRNTHDMIKAITDHFSVNK